MGGPNAGDGGGPDRPSLDDARADEPADPAVALGRPQAARAAAEANSGPSASRGMTTVQWGATDASALGGDLTASSAGFVASEHPTMAITAVRNTVAEALRTCDVLRLVVEALRDTDFTGNWAPSARISLRNRRRATATGSPSSYSTRTPILRRLDG